MLFNPATKRFVLYGIVGLVIAAGLIAGLQIRPPTVFPSAGILQIAIQSDPLTVTCHGKQGGSFTLMSLTVNITTVTVHREGVLNLTGEWIPLNDAPKTVHLLSLTSVSQLGSTSVQEGTINIVRIDVSGASALSDKGPVPVIVSSDHLQAEPSAQVSGGMRTSIVVMPHVVCQGNDAFRLTPELNSTSATSRE